jgi:predicted HD phosphohydrolase
MNPADSIARILESQGGDLYGGEAITQLRHALQSAWLAEEEGAPPALVAAALLHDLGHLVDKRFARGQKDEIDRRHEDIGAA